MACPKCGCKTVYQFDDEDDPQDDRLQRCAACGEVFDLDDEDEEDDENPEARALIAALERIAEWACYASEEDTSAKPLALQQIGVTAREALAAVGENTK